MIEITPGQAVVIEAMGDKVLTGEEIRRLLKLNHTPTNHIRNLLKAGVLEVVGVKRVKVFHDPTKPMYSKSRQFRVKKGIDYRVVSHAKGWHEWNAREVSN